MRGAWLAVVILTACGGTSRNDAATDAAAGSGGTNASGGTSGSSSSGGSAGSGAVIGIAGSGGQAGAAADGGISVADAGLFDCFGCACDGTTSYCYSQSAGLGAPPLPDAGACLGQDAGDSHCMPLPDTCVGAPSCGCLPQNLAWCTCEDVGGGLQVTCNYP